MSKHRVSEDRLTKLFNYIRAYKRTYQGRSPTRKELSRHIGVVSTNTVQHQLHILVQRGWITLGEKGEIHIVGESYDAPMEPWR